MEYEIKKFTFENVTHILITCNKRIEYKLKTLENTFKHVEFAFKTFKIREKLFIVYSTESDLLYSIIIFTDKIRFLIIEPSKTVNLNFVLLLKKKILGPLRILGLRNETLP